LAKKRIDAATAVILHHYPYSESSLLLDVFAHEFGRLVMIARGARRGRSVLRGLLMSFAPLELSWFGGGEVKTLAKAEWLGGIPLLSGKSLLVGYYLNELLLKLLPREDPHPQLFNAYLAAIRILAKGKTEAAELRRFERVLLRELGYGQELEKIISSGLAVQAEQKYTVSPGYGVQLYQFSSDKVAPIISGQSLLDMACDDYGRPLTMQESKAMMRYLINHYLGDQPLHSRRIFAQINPASTANKPPRV